MFHIHTLLKVNTYFQTFLSLFLLKFFLSSILLLDPPNTFIPSTTLFFISISVPPLLSTNIPRYLNSSTSSSFLPPTSTPPFLPPHLLIPTSNPHNFTLCWIDFQSHVCTFPLKLSHKYSQLFFRFCHQHRIICKK